MVIVMEIQKGTEVSTIVNTYESRADAENKYHTILAYAAVSNVPVHSAVMMTDNGEHIKNEKFEHLLQNGE